MNLIETTIKRPFSLAAFIIIVILLAFAPGYVERYTVISLITVLMYVILTLSWTMFSGPTHYISLATAAFFGVGVYTTAVIGKEISFPEIDIAGFIVQLPDIPMSLPAVAIIAGLICFALAFLIGLLTLRLKGIYFILFTFGASRLIQESLRWWENHITHTVGRFVRGPKSDTIYYYMLAIAVLVVVVAYIIRETKFGYALKCIGENEEAAAHIGINNTMMKVLGFSVSAVFMGITGAVMANRWTYIDPTIAFNPLISFLPVLMAIFGGTSRLVGPILGATIFTLLQEYLITEYPYYYMILMGTTLILVIMFLPDGLLGLVDKAIARVKHTKILQPLLAKLERD